MGGPTSSYATAGVVLRVIGLLKPPHHYKVEKCRRVYGNNSEEHFCLNGDEQVDSVIILNYSGRVL